MIIHALIQVIWGAILKYTVEKSLTNATNAILHHIRQQLEETVWLYISSDMHLEKSWTTNVILLGKPWKSTFKTNIVQCIWLNFREINANKTQRQQRKKREKTYEFRLRDNLTQSMISLVLVLFENCWKPGCHVVDDVIDNSAYYEHDEISISMIKSQLRW